MKNKKEIFNKKLQEFIISSYENYFDLFRDIFCFDSDKEEWLSDEEFNEYIEMFEQKFNLKS